MASATAPRRAARTALPRSRILLVWAPAAALVVLQLVFPYLPDAAVNDATVATVLLFLAASTLAAAVVRSGAFAVRFLTVAFLAGLAAEAIGVASGVPFGDYAYTGDLGPRIADVPIVIPCAWAMMAYPSWEVARAIAPRTPLARVGIGACALAAWDLALDPQMIRFGFWEWRDSGPYQDIPLANWAGWVGVGLVLFGVAMLMERRGLIGLDQRRPPRALALLPLALYAWTWIGETVAHALFWEGAEVALATFVCMGIFAVPALVAFARDPAWRASSS